MDKPDVVQAVTQTEYLASGCPYCKSDNSYVLIQTSTGSLFYCPDCKAMYIVVKQKGIK